MTDTPQLPENPRWKCPKCGSFKVQIGLPAWHYEGRDSLVYVETDAEASIMWWYCEDCDESDHGTPDEADPPPDPPDPNSNTAEYFAMFHK